MPNQFLKLFPSLFDDLKTGKHIFPPGASHAHIKTAEDNLGHSFPEDFRKFLLLTDGAQLFNETIRFFSVSELSDKNKIIQGNWFNSNHIFFAESENPDWYFIHKSDKSSIYYYIASPCVIEKSALSFSDWIKLLCKQKGLGIPKIPIT